MMGNTSTIVFLIQCVDQKGLVAAITGFFSERSYNILDCQQHTDSAQQRYFMRVKLTAQTTRDDAKLKADFAIFAQSFNLSWSIHYQDKPCRVALLVTKASHCPYDLLLRELEGELNCTITLIISNHTDLADMATQFGKPFYHLPISKKTKHKQEAHIKALINEHEIDLIVLARYMQILSPNFVADYIGRIINIHHGFLPAFQGAKPYHQAYDRGVKIIGATAHYATAELDEGPIIEQGVEHVMPVSSPQTLMLLGKDIERIVLAKAVKAHTEHRIIISGRKTIVFS